jgi:hypothetical protein
VPGVEYGKTQMSSVCCTNSALSLQWGKARDALSFIRIKTLFLRKRATRPCAFSRWAFSHHVA